MLASTMRRLSRNGSPPRPGIIAAIAAVLVPLIGAVLGGLTGMRFHRKVDKTGLGR